MNDDKDKLKEFFKNLSNTFAEGIKNLEKIGQINQDCNKVFKIVKELYESGSSPVSPNLHEIYGFMLMNELSFPKEIKISNDDLDIFSITYIAICLLDTKVKSMWITNNIEKERFAKAFYTHLMQDNEKINKYINKDKNIAFPFDRHPNKNSVFNTLKNIKNYSASNEDFLEEHYQTIDILIEDSKVRNFLSHPDPIFCLVGSIINNNWFGYNKKDLLENKYVIKIFKEKYKFNKIDNELMMMMVQISASYPKLNLKKENEETSSGPFGQFVKFGMKKELYDAKKIMKYIIDEIYR